MDHDLALLGPLASLLGVWEGDKGSDLALDHGRTPVTSLFRERITFAPLGRVDNHEQVLYGLKYATVAHRIGHDNAFHEEVGYWLWDARHGHVMRCFLVPRGVAVIAGGPATADARSFKLTAEAGSPTYGISSNQFLDAEFKITAYEVTVTCDGHTLSYDEDTVIRVKNKPDLFHHTDRNTLRKIS